MDDWKALFTERRKGVDQYLASCLHDRLIPERLQNAMEYSLLAGGKRIRPVLCLTCASLFGMDAGHVLPFAAAIELIHTYSLIHDDLPAMDNDDMRRGRPSNHKAFDEATALLAGDALLTDAFLLMTKADVSPGFLLMALAEIAIAAGSSGMVGGQEQDMELTAIPNATLEELRKVHARKTGALLRASCTSGAILAGVPPKTQDTRFASIATFGAEIGIAFQIVDDILDEVADPAVLGKPVHSDRENNKTTYPSLIGLEQSQILAREHCQNAKDALQNLPQGTEATFLSSLATYVVERVH